MAVMVVALAAVLAAGLAWGFRLTGAGLAVLVLAAALVRLTPAAERWGIRVRSRWADALTMLALAVALGVLSATAPA